MIPVKLADQVACLVTKSELFRIAREHDLRDVNAEELPLLGLAQTVEQDVVDGTFGATNDGFAPIFVKEARLVLHINLLLELEVTFTEDEDLALQSHIDIS